MSDENSGKLSRRALLKGLVFVATGASLGPALLSTEALASSKVSKKAMQYREKPNGDHQCSNCTHFIPGSSPSAMGKCQVVAGNISPHGWCIAWAAKQS